MQLVIPDNQQCL